MKQATTFADTLEFQGVSTKREKIDLLQVNLGKKCNQSCSHCHVAAGPKRTEEMSLKTIERVLTLLRKSKDIKTVDITGGAPELNPNFRYLICKLKDQKVNIINRCNLTVLFEEGQETMAEFLAENNVTIIASLPCYTQENVERQRGQDTYSKSIKALKLLNQLEYGEEGSGKVLNLVYNPLDAYLPGDQSELEADYKRELLSEHGIVFNELYTITNMPINRFAHMLIKKGTYDDYCNLLKSAFNSRAAQEIMCKHQISIGWDGKIFDCDFNQALDITVASKKESIWAIEDFEEVTKSISYAQHCFGCTAGCGSSCQGKLA